MPIKIKPDPYRLSSSKGHYKDYCFGATHWADTGESDGPLCCPLYIVEGTELTTTDLDGELVSADGYWCENCCRERGWLW